MRPWLANKLAYPIYRVVLLALLVTLGSCSQDKSPSGIVVRVYWTVSCQYCKAELDELNDVYDAWLAQGIGITTVNVSDSPAEITRVVEDRGYKFPVERGKLPAVGVPLTEVWKYGRLVAQRLGYISPAQIRLLIESEP